MIFLREFHLLESFSSQANSSLITKALSLRLLMTKLKYFQLRICGPLVKIPHVASLFGPLGQNLELIPRNAVDISF